MNQTSTVCRTRRGVTLPGPREFRPRIVREHQPRYSITSAEIAARYWKRHVTQAPWFDDEREIVVVLSCNVKNHILSFSLVAIGTVNSCTVHPRDVFRPAIAQNACAIVLMHNHPSGDPRPSVADGHWTKVIFESAGCLMIRFLDHIIVGADRTFFSFSGAGALESGHIAIRRHKRSQF